MQDVPFYAASSVALVSALAAVTRRNPIYSALWLMASFIAFAVIFLDLDAPFLAAMHVLLYTGAILVLFLFVIMLLNLKPEELAFDTSPTGKLVLGLLSAALGLLLVVLFVTRVRLPEPVETLPDGFGGAAAVGKAIFAETGPNFVLPFELVSVLIIAAMIGAILLARPERKKEDAP